MGNIERIGSSLRSLRKSKKITLQQVAQDTGLSTGYLSNIERNMTSPTLANIQKICEVLNSSLGDLLERNAEETIVIRKNDREIMVDESGMHIENIDFGIPNTSFLYVEMPPNTDTRNEWWTHEFDEVGTVLEGTMWIDMDGNTFELHSGDSIYVKAHTRHNFYNNSETETTRSYWTRIWIPDHTYKKAAE